MHKKLALFAIVTLVSCVEAPPEELLERRCGLVQLLLASCELIYARIDCHLSELTAS